MSEETTISQEEWFSLSNELEKYHAVFYKMWKMGKPVFTNSMPTAFVGFDREGNQIIFGINPKFWNTLDLYNKALIICHECLHVILNHGQRINKNFPELSNVTQDVVVNHILLSRYGFNRDLIKNWQKYCWIDTVFKGKKDVKKDETYEYYFNLLEKAECGVAKSGDGEGSGDGGKGDGDGNGTAQNGSQQPQTIDDHSKLGDFGEEETKEIIEKLNEELNDGEKNTLKPLIDKHLDNNSKIAGKTAGNYWCFAEVGEVKKKSKWETVIKKWASKQMKEDGSNEQWARLNRRFSFVGNDLMLPSEMECDNFEDEKIDVWFFQDTSGSCAGFKDRFFKAAKSLPTTKFNIRLHCFDTQVYETSLESRKLSGFGGTSFVCIESYIKAKINKEKKPYPLAVFVITDGYGDHVIPEKPKNWYWFLSEECYNYIPNESKKYMLKDFE